MGVTDVPAFIDAVLGDCTNRSDVWGREVVGVTDVPAFMLSQMSC